MGVIIRQNIFETNSSSTHSITIKPVNDSERIVGNVLYPKKLTTTFSEDNVCVLFCKTIPDKIMLLAHWIKDLENINDINGLCETLDNLSSYKINWNFKINYTCYNDDDFNYENELDTPEKLTNFFNKYINNEDFIIIYSNIQ